MPAARSFIRALATVLLVIGCHPSLQSSPGTGPSHAVQKGCASQFVTSGTVRGVIFSEACGPAFAAGVRAAADSAVIGYWQPTTATLEALEARLRPALEVGRSRPESLASMPRDAEARAEAVWGLKAAIGEILAHFGEFRRQYIGIVVRGGARRVLVNCFREVAPGATEEFPAWQNRWADADRVDDGGADYWRIEYDVSSGRFLGLDVNPSA
jgi:hypothetical protein